MQVGLLGKYEHSAGSRLDPDNGGTLYEKKAAQRAGRPFFNLGKAINLLNLTLRDDCSTSDQEAVDETSTSCITIGIKLNGVTH